MNDPYARLPSDRIEGGRNLAALRSHWRLIALFLVLAVVPTAYYSYTAPKRYKAEADLLVTPIPADDTTFIGINGLLRDSTQGQAVLTAGRIASAPDVGERVRSRLRLAKSPSVDVTPLQQSNVVGIVASASSPPAAARIANAYADAVISLRAAELQRELTAVTSHLEERLSSLAATNDPLSPVIESQIRQRLAQLDPLVGEPNPTLSILSRASEPGSASWPRPKLSILVAVLGSLLLAGGLALALGVKEAGGRAPPLAVSSNREDGESRDVRPEQGGGALSADTGELVAGAPTPGRRR
jgi:uncharacterized protein involved in exopolysaccharide biosynthesis